MKKAVADLAPTLPVKVISFSNKSAFYADLSHDMYVSGDATQRPLTDYSAAIKPALMAGQSH